MKELNEMLRNIEDGWVIVIDGQGERVIIDNAAYYLKDMNTYKLSCPKGFLVACYGEKSSTFNVTEIKDNRGNTVWKKPQPRKAGEIRQGDYFTRQDIEEYAECEGLSVKEVYQKLMDKMVEDGASRGEGVRYCGISKLKNYGWSNLTGGCYYSVKDFNHLSGEQLSVKEVLGEGYTLVSKVELERLRKIANSLVG